MHRHTERTRARKCLASTVIGRSALGAMAGSAKRLNRRMGGRPRDLPPFGAGLFLRSLLTLQETPLGFQPDHVLALRISATFSEWPEAVVQRHQRTMDVLSSLPGVQAVAMSRGIPGTMSVVPMEFRLVGE